MIFFDNLFLFKNDNIEMYLYKTIPVIATQCQLTEGN